MATNKLCSMNLGDLNKGKLGVEIDTTLQQILRDLDERGSDEKDRELTIKLKMRKEGEAVLVDGHVGFKVPARETNTESCVIKTNGKHPYLLFDVGGDDPDQQTFPGMGGGNGKKKKGRAESEAEPDEAE